MRRCERGQRGRESGCRIELRLPSLVQAQHSGRGCCQRGKIKCHSERPQQHCVPWVHSQLGCTALPQNAGWLCNASSLLLLQLLSTPLSVL